ncbi:hypothetical protein EVA_13571, partial [gut metagenome]
MSSNFKTRHRRVQSFRECLLQDNEGRQLLSELSLAARAGAVIAPVLKPFHFNIDFTDPAHCRIEGDTLILLVSSAIQENRLRQLQKRIKTALAVAGLPLTSIAIHIIPPSVETEYGQLELPHCERPSSASGAAAIDRTLSFIEDPALKDTLGRLRDTLAPATPTGSSALEAKLAQESLTLAMRRRELSILEGDLQYGLQAISIPTEEEAAEFPPLAGARARLLAKHAQQSA